MDVGQHRCECTEFLGPAGYGYVQASPAQETIQGAQWWTDYQPVSYTLTGKRGNRAQYQAMIQTCHAAGVKVIADTVMNHMTGVDSGTGTAGTQFTQFNYPGLYTSKDFHYCNLEPNNVIVNYKNRLEVQTCELEGLADLATDTEHVRATLAQYLNDLISLGVDGMRLDAAKHMNTADIANILSRTSSPVYITQEVIWGAGEPIQPAEYVQNGDVQEFRYTSALNSAFSPGGNLTKLQNLDAQGWVPGTNANVFVANHDTERGGDSLNSSSPSNTYTNAMIFSLAHPYGQPTILSSYSFTDQDAGAPRNGVGACYGAGGVGGWLCQHRWTGVAGMVGFRNTVGNAAMSNWMSVSARRIAFGRGSRGFVAINNADASWQETFSTSLPSGTYCDVVSGSLSDSSCSGSSFSVSSSGRFSVTVPPRGAIAIHVGARR